MKTVLLCLSLCSLAWAQSELQPHYRKTKQKCVGEHQIMLKGRHSKHGFYIFNYMYSSSGPENQTQIQKEDSNKTVSTATDGLDKKHKPRKPSDNLTDSNQETRGGQKHLTGEKDDRKPENRTTPGRKQNVKEHHGNIRNWDLQQQVELITGKGGGDFAKGDDTNEIDGSGDIDLPGQVGTHHGIAIGNEGGDQGKDHQITRDPESGTFEGKGQGGKHSVTKPSKKGTMKIWAKGNEFSVIQETNAYSDIPKKIKEPQNKDYSGVSLIGKTDATNKESGQEAGDLSDKEANLTARLHSRFRGPSNVSREILGGKVQVANNSNFTSSLDTDEIKIASENGSRNATAHRKGEYEPTVIVSKLKDQFGVSRSHQNSESRGDRGSHVEVAGTIKPHKKDNARGDVATGMSSSNTEATAISKTRKKDKSETGVRGKLTGQVEDPIFTKPGKRKHSEASSISETKQKEKSEADSIEKLASQVKDPALTKPGKTNQSGTILSGKLDVHVDGSAVPEPYADGEEEKKRISGRRVATSGTTERDRKDSGAAGIARGTSKAGHGDLGLTQAPRKEVASHEKTSTQTRDSSSGDPTTHEIEKNRFGITFQDVGKVTMKGSVNDGKPPGAITRLKKSDDNVVESSDRKGEQPGQDVVQLKGALSLPPGSHDDDMQHLFNLPKNENVKGQEHSLPSVKMVKKVIKLGKGTDKVHTGTYGDEIAKRHQKYSGGRRSSQHAKHHPSLKKAHGSDSSPSSESKEERRKESRESYEDYPNDRVDSHPSAESAEDLSPESNQSDNRSGMED